MKNEKKGIDERNPSLPKELVPESTKSETLSGRGTRFPQAIITPCNVTRAPPLFSSLPGLYGNENEIFERHRKKFDALCMVSQINGEINQMFYFVETLKGRAFEWYSILPKDSIENMSTFVEKFLMN